MGSIDIEESSARLMTDLDWEDIHELFTSNKLDRPLALAGIVELAKRSRLYVAWLTGRKGERPRIVGVISLSIVQTWEGEVGYSNHPLIAPDLYTSDLATRLSTYVMEQGLKLKLLRIEHVYPPSTTDEEERSPPPSIH